MLTFSFIYILVEDELQCFKCSSDETTSCVTLFGIEDWEVEACEEGITECGVWVDGTVTIRGCIPENLPENLETCNEDLCNTFEWPVGRKQCNQCSGRACVLDPGTETVCVNYQEDDECYVVVQEIDRAFRGCTSDATDTEGKQICSSLAEFCQIGDQNSQRGYQDPILSCVQCTFKINQENDESCITKAQPGLCAVSILLGRPSDQCFTSFDTQTLIRDCILTGANRLICQNTQCSTCDTNGCNNERYFLRKCIQCDSSQDPNCIDKPELTGLSNCAADNEVDNACFREEKREVGVELTVRRDCVNALSTAEEAQCLLQTNNCKVCFEDECNKKVNFQECYTCDSVTDRNCITFKFAMPFLTCREYLDTCGTAINTDGHTIRSCSSNLPSSNLQELCEPNRCNNQIVPRNRLSCHQCHATEECALAQSEETQEFCQIYKPEDACYETTDSLGRTHRGCLSDPDSNCGERCNRCITQNCNRNPSSATPTLSCITCTPSEPWCRWGFEPIQATKCVSFIPIGTTEQCFTRIHENKVAERGCTNDVVNYCNGIDVESCQTCDTSGCNGANTMQQSCVVCDSRDDTSCIQGNYLPSVKTCIQPGRNILQYANRGCYTLRDNEGYVIRGCFADLDNNWKEQCQQSNRCERCFEQNCNIKRPPNSGKAQVASITLTLTVLVLSYLT